MSRCTLSSGRSMHTDRFCRPPNDGVYCRENKTSENVTTVAYNWSVGGRCRDFVGANSKCKDIPVIPPTVNKIMMNKKKTEAKRKIKEKISTRLMEESRHGGNGHVRP